MLSAPAHPQLHALHQAAEAAAGRYRAAHRAMTDLSRLTAGLAALVRQHPRRVDYRAAWSAARNDFITACQRADCAWKSYQAATLRADAAWTQTQAGAA